MNIVFNIVLTLHIAAGAVALATFVPPLLSRKGGRSHRTVGFVFCWCMGFVAASAVGLAALRLLTPLGDGRPAVFSLFLVFVAGMAAVSSWYGLRVLRFGARTQPHRNWKDISPSLLLILGGLGMSLVGWRAGNGLLMGFPFIGIFLGIGHLVYWWRSPRHPRHAMLEHMGGMFAAGISAVTAFVVAGLPGVLEMSAFHWLLWVAPSLLMVPVLVVWQQILRARHSDAPRPPETPAASR